ncbi:PIG-L family deacetylase [archaeon]|jgi:N-acetylglucosamine malate deacetylase 1|nr:PIG-L family deacetylase [archaeon]MBT4416868.1 PIG-L family deacetylase [archaeon]
MPNILIFCAHSDDEAIGMSGTIAKYVEQKKKVIKVVLSHGEMSHPHFQEKHVKKARKKETKKASEMIGIKETMYLGLKDASLKREINKPKVERQIKGIIKRFNPEKIYCTSAKDPHPDHRAVNKIVLQIVDTFRKKYPVYGYEVWNIQDETHPRVYVDISGYMDQKLEYIKMFKSQWVFMFSLYLPALFRAKKFGAKNHCKYAERFYKLR